MKPVALVKDTSSCCGCGACLSVCPVEAITMKEDILGCQYPEINLGKCIGCEKCIQICSYAQKRTEDYKQTAYAAIGRDEQLVQKSASGGAFASLAKRLLEDGGMAAGAVLDCTDSRAEVYHVLSDEMKDLLRMQGSKYVQSEAWRCYDDVIQALKAGKQVLFSGTPCQVGAVKALTGNPENLITMDLICHGVPPLRMLNNFLKILSQRFGAEICDLQFREKNCEKNYCACIELQNRTHKRLYIRSNDLSFYTLFLKNVICRENCYSCPYANMERVSDLTIGDYWGIEKHHEMDFAQERMPRRKDWSCVLVNTERGAAFLEKYGQDMSMFPTEANWVAEHNEQLRAACKKPQSRAVLLEKYSEGGYEAVEKDFIKKSGGFLRYYWRLMKNILRNKKVVSKNKQYEN